MKNIIETNELQAHSYFIIYTSERAPLDYLIFFLSVLTGMDVGFSRGAGGGGRGSGVCAFSKKKFVNLFFKSTHLILRALP